MSSKINKNFFFLNLRKINLILNRIFTPFFYFALQVVFTINCNSMSINKTSKFETLWKEPANPPPQSALIPESNTVPTVKKK
jgi:hypothetical protein